MNQAYSPARSGDIYLYDAGNGVYTHMTMSTGYGTFPSKVDPYKSDLRYDGVTGGVGDYMNGHTRERERAPWNIGYWEANATDRLKMNTVIMHMFDTF
jgi:hypothetical protein